MRARSRVGVCAQGAPPLQAEASPCDEDEEKVERRHAESGDLVELVIIRLDDLDDLDEGGDRSGEVELEHGLVRVKVRVRIRGRVGVGVGVGVRVRG